MGITISADDPRTIRAIEIAAEADHWLVGHNRAGDEVYAIPSQSDSSHYYIVTHSSCDCPDFRRNAPPDAAPREVGEAHACKHMLAVRLHTELVRAQQHQIRQTSPRHRGHLSLVPTGGGVPGGRVS